MRKLGNASENWMLLAIETKLIWMKAARSCANRLALNHFAPMRAQFPLEALLFERGPAGRENT